MSERKLKSRKKLVILSGAGISAESGLGTFRDSDGLWEKYDINDVATIDAWYKNKKLVLDFYNARRIQNIAAQPNLGHLALVDLEDYFDVYIITQNIDDLHERAGSSNVTHLHGEIMKGKSEHDEGLIFDLKHPEIQLGDKAADGHQMRPHVVWFGEAVPMMNKAEEIMVDADIVLVVGTSLNVYPAANLIYSCPTDAVKYIVDPNDIPVNSEFTHLKGTATSILPKLKTILRFQE
ncbi:Sir2 family NAD-dependent protein deacetylase [Crocinitomix catalasitica]|uniref:Sir2 family NAD-dependent protein deacetylase n=1 Tax=Crocinitomix catalasitica TaxID=184607 RepID=UPI00056D316C|nr:Sir2 family NAD-dependent protein deacetylase [Crocinitomix catalasitica]